MNQPIEKIRVWDLPLRVFHWSLATGVLLAYLTAKSHYGFIHIWIGYFLCVLMMGRLIWGFVGSKYSRFNSFTFSLQETFQYFFSKRGHSKHYLGHNPAGALMIFSLFGLLTLTFVSGLVSHAFVDFDGPLLFIARFVSEEMGYAIRNFHTELYVAWLFIIIHVIGVLWVSVSQNENLVWSMVTGMKKRHLTRRK